MVIGLNTGAGSRWKRKTWEEEEFVNLIHLIQTKLGASILLLGGIEERPRNRRIFLRSTPGKIIDGEGAHPLRPFASLINQCSLVVTGDTLAMHMAVALKKKVVAIFGPTSQSEVDLAGKGLKVSAEMDCLGCYLTNCQKDPHCMNSLKAEKVFEAVASLVGQ